MIAKKECTKCHRVLVITEFHKDRRKTDGLDSWCKECSNEARERRRSKALEAQVCSRCKRELPLDAFPPSARGRKGDYCRECRAEYRKAAREARRKNPGGVIALEPKGESKIVSITKAAVDAVWEAFRAVSVVGAPPSVAHTVNAAHELTRIALNEIREWDKRRTMTGGQRIEERRKLEWPLAI